MKKIITLLISVAMVLCMMPTVAFAETQTTDLTTETVTVTLDSSSFTYNGSAQKPKITVTYTASTEGAKSVELKEGSDYTLEFQRNSETTTDFTSAGTISVTKVTGKGSYSGEVDVTGKSYKIAQKSITNPTVTEGYMAPVTATATADTLLAKVSLRDSQTGKALAAGTDFDLKEETITDDSTKNTRTITVTANGNYTGERTITFSKGIDLGEEGKTTVTTSEQNFTYNGTAQKYRTVTVKYDGKLLTETKDYVISYENNTNATSTAKLIIEGRGDYAGQVEKTFEIAQKSIASVSVEAIPNQLIGAEPTPVVKDTGITGSPILPASDYSCEYENNNAIGTATLTIRAPTAETTPDTRKSPLT